MKALPILFLLLTTAAFALPAAEPAYAPHVRSGTLGTIERLSPDLDALLPATNRIEILAEGFAWSEGPVWHARDGYLLFSDVPKNVVWRWRQQDGLLEYLRPSGYIGPESLSGEPGSNGLTLDNEGRLILCQHGERQVARITGRGRFEPLATNIEGKRFNSPNDVAIRANGELYFTDPPYGLAKGMDDPSKELPFQGVYRLSRRGKITLLIRNLTRPNGIAFSPDEKKLYIAVSDPERAHYMAYNVDRDGNVDQGKVLFDATPLVAGRKGLPDGLKVDNTGNLWASGPGGILILTPQGRHLGTINTGVATANCAWGNDGSVLYITADSYLCRVQTRTKGPMPGPLPERRR